MTTRLPNICSACVHLNREDTPDLLIDLDNLQPDTPRCTAYPVAGIPPEVYGGGDHRSERGDEERAGVTFSLLPGMEGSFKAWHEFPWRRFGLDGGPDGDSARDARPTT